MRIIKLFLINPATSCSPESSFSKARRLKSWLWSTMTSQRFNGLALLNVHKKCTDRLHLMEVGSEFIDQNEQRGKHFGYIPKTNFRFCLILFCSFV